MVRLIFLGIFPKVKCVKVGTFYFIFSIACYLCLIRPSKNHKVKIWIKYTWLCHQKNLSYILLTFLKQIFTSPNKIYHSIKKILYIYYFLTRKRFQNASSKHNVVFKLQTSFRFPFWLSSSDFRTIFVVFSSFTFYSAPAVRPSVKTV